MPDFRTEKDVDAFVASRDPGLGRLVLCLRLADGRLAGPEAELVRQWLRDRPGPGEAMQPVDRAAGWGLGAGPEGRGTAFDGLAPLLATVAGLCGVVLLLGSAWLPAWR